MSSVVNGACHVRPMRQDVGRWQVLGFTAKSAIYTRLSCVSSYQISSNQAGFVLFCHIPYHSLKLSLPARCTRHKRLA